MGASRKRLSYCKGKTKKRCMQIKRCKFTKGKKKFCRKIKNRRSKKTRRSRKMRGGSKIHSLNPASVDFNANNDVPIIEGNTDKKALSAVTK